MKVAFAILNMPGGTWHWVIRLWTKGPDQPFTVIAAKAACASAESAWREAVNEIHPRPPEVRP